MPNGVQYQILRADKAGMPPLDDRVYDDPAYAAEYARYMARERGEKLIVKAIVDAKWRVRERARINDGTYRPMPWRGHDWWRSDAALAIHKDHFPHPSIEKPGYLAYTKSPEDGAKDKQTIVKPGTYLNQYFEQIIKNYGESEPNLVSLFMQAYGPVDIKFATTDEEMIAVYDRGPNTCMKGKAWPGDGRNPAHVYNAGDLQIAYLGTLNRASARTLVWPAKKTYSRVYGDIARITTALERLGYKWGAPIGAKIKRLQLREVKFDPNRGSPSACFVVPYLDKKNQAGGGHLSVMDKGDHLVICEEGTPGSHHCGLADGYSGQYIPRADEYPTFTCDKCGTPGHRELIPVYIDQEGTDQETWCTKCAQRQARNCAYSGAWFSRTEVEFVSVGGRWWNKYYADMHAAECEETGTLHAAGDLVKLYDADNKLKRVCHEWINDHGGMFNSHLSKRAYLKRHLVHVLGLNGQVGYYAARPELKTRCFQCDGCDQYGLVENRLQPFNDDRLFCTNCDTAIKKRNGLAPISASRREFEALQAKRRPLIAAE